MVNFVQVSSCNPNCPTACRGAADPGHATASSYGYAITYYEEPYIPPPDPPWLRAAPPASRPTPGRLDARARAVRAIPRGVVRLQENRRWM